MGAMIVNVKITFGMIVLNGEPFLRYNLRSLYAFAHQIIVVEGACPSAATVATADGHSMDGTLEVLQDFKLREDPENKVVIVSASDEAYTSGFWPEKSEMSYAYAKRATGNYLWQVDSDEFYHEEQTKQLISILEKQKPDAVSFPSITFWGGVDYITDSFYLIRDNAREFHRLFAWGPGYVYTTHFVPTVVDERGVDLRRKTWLRARDLEKRNIFLHHYSLLFPQQVLNKVKYYKVRNRSAIDLWEQSVYRGLARPFRVHNVYVHISWLERFTGEHPGAIQAMMQDIKEKRIRIKLRDCQDVERLLSRRSYVLAVIILRASARVMARQPFNFLYRACASVGYKLKGFFRRTPIQVDLDI